jgi:hypothetical protein
MKTGWAEQVDLMGAVRNIAFVRKPQGGRPFIWKLPKEVLDPLNISDELFTYSLHCTPMNFPTI